MQLPFCIQLFRLSLYSLCLFAVIPTSTCIAITLPQIDDFQDGLTQNWTSGGVTTTSNLSDTGPNGTGDNALEVTTNGRAVVFNEVQWSGNWTSAGIQSITMDIRSLPTNTVDLTMWLGISSGGPPTGGGGGDTYVTSTSATVPNDGLWHSISFDVAKDDWTSFSGSNIEVALTDVYQFRILHNSDQSFLGEANISGFHLDNIIAHSVPEPSSLFLGVATALGGSLLLRSSSRRPQGMLLVR